MEAELSRATSMKSLTDNQAASLRSLDCAGIRVPEPTTPVVSIATGSSKYLFVFPWYLIRLRSSAAPAAAPGAIAELITELAL